MKKLLIPLLAAGVTAFGVFQYTSHNRAVAHAIQSTLTDTLKTKSKASEELGGLLTRKSALEKQIQNVETLDVDKITASTLETAKKLVSFDESLSKALAIDPIENTQEQAEAIQAEVNRYGSIFKRPGMARIYASTRISSDWSMEVSGLDEEGLYSPATKEIPLVVLFKDRENEDVARVYLTYLVDEDVLKIVDNGLHIGAYAKTAIILPD